MLTLTLDKIKKKQIVVGFKEIKIILVLRIISNYIIILLK